MSSGEIDKIKSYLHGSQEVQKSNESYDSLVKIVNLLRTEIKKELEIVRKRERSAMDLCDEIDRIITSELGIMGSRIFIISIANYLRLSRSSYRFNDDRDYNVEFPNIVYISYNKLNKFKLFLEKELLRIKNHKRVEIYVRIDNENILEHLNKEILIRSKLHVGRLFLPTTIGVDLGSWEHKISDLSPENIRHEFLAMLDPDNLMKFIWEINRTISRRSHTYGDGSSDASGYTGDGDATRTI